MSKRLVVRSLDHEQAKLPPTRYYPAFLSLSGRLCVVVGSGQLADQKERELRDCGAVVDVRGDVAPGDLRGVHLVVDASGDPAINRRVAAEARRERALLNTVDVPELCDFITPAVVRRDPLQVAISTGGESPFLASALRIRLERLLSAEWGPFTALVGRTRRRLREQGVAPADQISVYKRLLAGPVRSLLRAGRVPAAEFEAAAIASVAGIPGPGRVALVGAGPGDPGLLTLAGAELLWQADCVLHDALVDPATLALAGPKAEIIDVGKRAGGVQARQADINAMLVRLAREGRQVVRLKGGDPFVFGRGGEELAELVAAGIEVVIVPGVTSAVAAPGLAGIPLTLRGVASSVAIATGQSCEDNDERLIALARSADTLVVLMALDRLERICAALVPVLGPERPAAVVSGASSEGQRQVRGQLGRLPSLVRDAGLVAPATLVIGEVVGAASAPACVDQAVPAISHV